MRNLILVVALMTVAVAAFAACGTSVDNATVTVPAVPGPSSAANTPKPKDPADDAPRITLADAKNAFDAGSVVFIDTRAEAQFKQERIKGSINIPFDSPDSRFSEIPKGKKIIAYCS